MKSFYLFTAEPNNFVPKRLKEEAESLGYEAQIIDVTHCVIAEGVDGKNESVQCCSEIFVFEKDGENGEPGKVYPLKIDSDTIVIPRLNEYHLEMKLSMLQRMESKGASLLNSARSMELCNDKLMSQVLLNTAGIKTPYSFTMQKSDDVEKIVDFMEAQERLKFPVIVKTLRGTHGIGVMKLDSRSSLVSVAQMLLKEEIEFMVQEFIEHDQSARIIMIGDQVLAANLRGQAKDKDEFRTNSHLGSETEPYNPPDEEVALGRKIVELFGCKFCAIDYIVHEGEIIVLEVNGSPGLEAISKNWPDKNLPLTVIKFAAGNENNWTATAPEQISISDSDSISTAAEIDPVTPDESTQDLPSDTLEEVEAVHLHRIMDPDQTVDARIDTGAKTSSIHADHITFDEQYVKFRRGQVTFKTPVSRIVKIKNVHNGQSTRRPVITLDITIHGKRFNQIEFTITDRSNMKYEVLIGRNVLELIGLPVLISKDSNVEAPESDTFQVEEE